MPTIDETFRRFQQQAIEEIGQALIKMSMAMQQASRAVPDEEQNISPSVLGSIDLCLDRAKFFIRGKPYEAPVTEAKPDRGTMFPE